MCLSVSCYPQIGYSTFGPDVSNWSYKLGNYSTKQRLPLSSMAEISASDALMSTPYHEITTHRYNQACSLFHYRWNQVNFLPLFLFFSLACGEKIRIDFFFIASTALPSQFLNATQSVSPKTGSFLIPCRDRNHKHRLHTTVEEKC